MAENKGTGHHPHKSSEEPYSHHEAPTTSGQGQHASSGGSGTSGSSRSGSSGSGSSSQSNSRSSENRGKSDENLNAREYKGPQGEEHHHTKTYMEQHKKSA